MNNRNKTIDSLTVAAKNDPQQSTPPKYSQHDLYAYALTMVDAIQGIVVILDRSGHVLYRNRTCKELFAGLETLAENTTLWDAVDWTDGVAALKRQFGDSDGAPTTQRVDMQYRDPKAGIRRLSWTVRPLPSHLGMAALYVLTGCEGADSNEIADVISGDTATAAVDEGETFGKVNATVLSLLQAIGDRLAATDRHLVDLLRNALESLADPITDRLDQQKYNLTPREIDVASMIRRGFSSKQIASVLNLSIHTVHNQRRSIRKKLKIDNDNTNLESYLKSL